MPFLSLIWQNKSVRYATIGFGACVIIVISFLLWLAAHDSAIIASNNAMWQAKIASGALNTSHTDYVATPIPTPKPQPPQKKVPEVILKSEHQRLLDSATVFWKSIGADKDSLIGSLTQIQSATFDDSIGTYFVTVCPLDPKPIMFQPIYKERTIPLPHTTETKVLLKEDAWYETRIAYYIYGAATLGLLEYAREKVIH